MWLHIDNGHAICPVSNTQITFYMSEYYTRTIFKLQPNIKRTRNSPCCVYICTNTNPHAHTHTHIHIRRGLNYEHVMVNLKIDRIRLIALRCFIVLYWWKMALNKYKINTVPLLLKYGLVHVRGSNGTITLVSIHVNNNEEVVRTLHRCSRSNRISAWYLICVCVCVVIVWG